MTEGHFKGGLWREKTGRKGKNINLTHSQKTAIVRQTVKVRYYTGNFPGESRSCIVSTRDQRFQQKTPNNGRPSKSTAYHLLHAQFRPAGTSVMGPSRPEARRCHQYEHLCPGTSPAGRHQQRRRHKAQQGALDDQRAA